MKKTMKLLVIILISGLLMIACPVDDDHTCDFVNWTQTTAPTCAAKGIETGTCSCGAATTRDGADINPDAHDLEPTENNTATCIEGGVGDLACTRCEHTVEEAATPELGHAPGNWVQTIEPTCTEDGIETGTCTRDGCNETNTPRKGEDKLGHYKNGRDCTNLCFSFDFVLVEKGTFLMGPDSNNSDPIEVKITKNFYMSKYQVTQELYQAVMGTNPSSFLTGVEIGEEQGKRPVEQVNWYHAIAFCNRLSILEGLTPVYTVADLSNSEADAWLHFAVPRRSNATWNEVTADWTVNGYRLPTEAQWEFAAKGGNDSEGFIYSGSNNIDEVAWYIDNSGDNETSTNIKTHEVGKKAPNELGLYDMSGNVWEWCWDWWANYPGEAVEDYTGADKGSHRVWRGGSWNDADQKLRSAIRYRVNPDIKGSLIGFRVVRPLV